MMQGLALWVAGVAALLLACRDPGAGAVERTAVKVARVERAGSSVSTRYSAQIEPATRVELAFKVGGYVASIEQVTGVDGKPRLLQEGDRVRANAELASIRKTDYEQKLREASASLGQAISAAEQARLDFDRTQKLAEHGTASPAQLDAARIRRDSANASLDGARVRVEEARTALADTSMRSPIDGVVTGRSIEVGTLAASGMIAFVVAETDRVKAVFGVPDTVLPRVSLGAAQAITTESLRDVSFAGQITRIAPTADVRSRVFEVEVTVPNPDQQLKSGMVAALALADGAALDQETPLVPLSAIVRSAHEGRFAVYVVDDSGPGPVARSTDVELGDYLGNVIPVTRGLRGGEQVVVMGAGLLSDGEPVELIP